MLYTSLATFSSVSRQRLPDKHSLQPKRGQQLTLILYYTLYIIICGREADIIALAQAGFFAVIVKNLGSTNSDPKHSGM